MNKYSKFSKVKEVQKPSGTVIGHTVVRDPKKKHYPASIKNKEVIENTKGVK